MTNSTIPAEAMGSPAPVTASYRWEVPGKDISIQMSLDLIDRLEREVIDSFKAVTKRGSEVGGILLGRVSHTDRPHVFIENYEQVTCDYTRGPLYLLSDDDKDRLRQALQRLKNSPLAVVGFFRSNTRKDLIIDQEEDFAIGQEFFSDPNHAFLLVKPFAMKPSAAGFFLWENGQLQLESQLQFPFRRSELMKAFPESIVQAGAGGGPATAPPAPAAREERPSPLVFPKREVGPTVVPPPILKREEPKPGPVAVPPRREEPAPPPPPVREERPTPPISFRREDRPVIPPPPPPVVKREEPPAPAPPPVSFRREERTVAPPPPPPPVLKREEPPAPPVSFKREERPAPPLPKPQERPAPPPILPKREERPPLTLKREERPVPPPVTPKREEPAPPPVAKREERPPILPKREERPAPVPSLTKPTPPPVAPKQEEPPKREERPEVKPIAAKREEVTPAPKKEERVAAAPAPKVEPAPVVAAPIVEQALPSVSAEPEKKSKMWLVAVAIIALLALIGAGYYFFVMRTAPAPAKVAETSLGLKVDRNAGQLQLSWNRDAEIVKTAQKAILSITDGDHTEDVPLDPGQLRGGSIVYAPISNDVSFKLEATDVKKGISKSESVRVLAGRPSSLTAQAPPRQAAATPAPLTPTQPAGQTQIPGQTQNPAAATPATPTPSQPAPVEQVRTFTLPPVASSKPTVAPGTVTFPEPPKLDLEGSAVNSARPIPSGGVAAPPPNAPPPPSPAKQETARTAAQPTAQPGSASPTPLRVGGKVQEARILSRVQPNYPQLARQSRITGNVRVEATIDKSGRVKAVRAVSGPPLLRRAAEDAVRQWKYQPGTLNGEPVEVTTQVDVGFTLQR